MVGETLDEALETTSATLDTLPLPRHRRRRARLIAPFLEDRTRAVVFDGAARPRRSSLSTVVGEGVTVAREVERLGERTLFIGGALTQEFVDDFARALPPRRELRLVVRDATVLVLPAAAVSRHPQTRHRARSAHPLRVLAVTANPFRVPQPYQPKIFFSAVADAVGDRVPVFDVVNGLARLPEGSPASSAGADSP